MSWFWWNANKKSGPRYEARPILAQNKAKFFVRLCKALPTCYIFPQVALSALLTPTATNHKRQREDSEKISGMMVDYAIYNANLTLVCVVCLNDGSSDADTNATIDRCLKGARINSMRWDAETRPSVEQIHRTLLPSLNRAMAARSPASQAAFEAKSTIQVVAEQGGAGQQNPDHTSMMRQSSHASANTTGLSAAKLDQLTPNKVLHTNYPHIWQRISVFAIEPKHLKKYLLSLSMQDRKEKRAGFSLEALKEIADIQIQNDRFLMETVRSWQPGFVNP